MPRILEPKAYFEMWLQDKTMDQPEVGLDCYSLFFFFFQLVNSFGVSLFLEPLTIVPEPSKVP